MSSIKDTEKVQQRQLETLRRRNDREIKNIETAHSAYKADLKTAQTSEIVDLQDVHHRQLNVENEKKEKVLTEMKNHLDQTSKLTDKQLKELKDNAEATSVDVQRKLSVDRERVNAENELHLEEMNDRFKTASQKINYEGRKQMDEMKDTHKSQYLNTEASNQLQLNNQRETFTNQIQVEGNNYKKVKTEQDNYNKKERASTNLRQQTELQKMTDTHTQHIEKKDGEFRKGLKDQDLFFEDKYAKQLGKHNADFKTLEDKNKKVIADLKQNLAQEITQAANRNDDPFYKFETLRPRLRNIEDGIEIEVDVPEHAKKDIQLTTNGKEAIITLNRRYADATRSENGTINKVNKVESFTTRLATGVILDAKSIKSNYDNGVMTYTVKKT